MRLIKDAKQSPPAKFYSLSTITVLVALPYVEVLQPPNESENFIVAATSILAQVRGLRTKTL